MSELDLEIDPEPQNAKEWAAYLVNEFKVGLFPRGKVGHHALILWNQIRGPLLRGDTIQISVKVLGLKMHRQQLKRARDAMIEIDLIRPTGKDHYRLGRYDACEELVRQEFQFLCGVERLYRLLKSIN